LSPNGNSRTATGARAQLPSPPVRVPRQDAAVCERHNQIVFDGRHAKAMAWQLHLNRHGGHLPRLHRDASWTRWADPQRRPASERSRLGYTERMTKLNPTAPDLLVDGQGRPYFLWDMDLTLSAFRERLDDADPEVRAFFIGKLMRQAKPDDVFAFVSPRTILDLWPQIERHLGHARAFWTWLFDVWNRLGYEWQ
jgi:hypothetical protein